MNYQMSDPRNPWSWGEGLAIFALILVIMWQLDREAGKVLGQLFLVVIFICALLWLAGSVLL